MSHEAGRWTRRGWVLNIAVWSAFGLIAAGQTYFRPGEPRVVPAGLALLSGLGLWLFYAAITPLVFRLGRRFPLERGVLARSLAVHAAAAVALALVHGVLTAVVTRAIFPPATGEPARPLSAWITSYLVYRSQFELLAYFAILGVGQALDYYRRFRERETRSLQLETQLAQAQLRALKMQLHPHFLFNTLHAIAVLIREDPAAATRTVTLLGDLLRHTLAHAGTNQVSLRLELEFLQLYLEIEQLRFHDRLTVAFDVAPDTLETPVPHFVLQPLVENAIRHGVAPRAEPGRIEIRARRGDADVLLEVWNDGPPLAPRPAGTGIGLATTRDRLARLYDGAGRLELADAPGGGVVARVRIPLPAAAGAA